MTGRYRAVFAIPHLPGLLGWALAGRLHMTGTSLAITFLMASRTGSYTRAGWARLASPALRDSVYTVDATLQELLFVIGPVAVAATITLAGLAPGTLLLAGFVLVGGLGFAMAMLVPVLGVAGSPVALGVVLFLGGTAIAPALGAVYGAVAQRAPQYRRAEAFGWQSTASTAGSALAAPVVGICLDRFGPAAGAAVAAVALAIAVVVTVAGATRPHRAATS